MALHSIPTTIDKYPYVVSLRTENNDHFCGGSIISNKHILTAAHCLEGIKPSQFFVYTGTSYVSLGEKHSIKDFTLHPYYQGQKDHWRHDIAVIEVWII